MSRQQGTVSFYPHPAEPTLPGTSQVTVCGLSSTLGWGDVKVEGQLGPKPFTNANSVDEPHVNNTDKRRLPGEGALCVGFC